MEISPRQSGLGRAMRKHKVPVENTNVFWNQPIKLSSKPAGGPTAS